MTLHPATGTLRYSPNVYRLVVDVDQQLADYYRSLIPKYIWTNRPRWGAHITVVRQEKETPLYEEHWQKYDGQKVTFYYEPTIHSGRIYFWLNIFCKPLEEIRLELGLQVVSMYTIPPEGFKKCFHCTIANVKGYESYESTEGHA
jgi:hypothetical protein